jgi:hypothetical protein
MALARLGRKMRRETDKALTSFLILEVRALRAEPPHQDEVSSQCAGADDTVAAILPPFARLVAGSSLQGPGKRVLSRAISARDGNAADQAF